MRGARCNSTEGPASQTAREKITERSQGISARLKELSRKYGWAAFGVYMGLSALDFPFCFLAVRLVGTERIEAVERVVVHAFWNIVAKVYPSAAPVQTEPAKDVIDLSAQDEAAKKSSHHGASGPYPAPPACILADDWCSSWHPAAPGIRCAQIPHFLPCSTGRCGHAKSRQMASRTRLEYRKAKADGRVGLERSDLSDVCTICMR